MPSESVELVHVASLQPSSNGLETSVRPSPSSQLITATSSQTEQGESAANELGEILVTAQRRTQRLQDVPISIVAFTGDEMAEANITNLTALAQNVPGVHIGSGGVRTTTLIIRGIGSGINQAFDQAVGVFVDDIYHGRSRVTAATFLDIERLEVLKGPQSTFFGNNVIAGAFSITTQKRTDIFNGNARAAYGQHGEYALEAAVGLPLTESLGIRLAIGATGHSGWIKNVHTDDTLPRESNWAGRAMVTFQPSDAINLNFKAERGESRVKGGLDWLVSACPPPFGAPAGFCASRIAQNLPLSPEDRLNSSSSGGDSNFAVEEYVLTANIDIGDHALTSVTGIHKYDQYVKADQDFLPANSLHGHLSEKYNQFSQEIRLSSPIGGAIEYIAGLYYMDSRLQVNQEQVYFVNSQSIASNPTYAALVPYLPLGHNIRYRQEEKSYAAFASVTWNVSDTFDVTAALRYSLADKEGVRTLVIGTAQDSYGGIVSIPPQLFPIADRLNIGKTGVLNGKRRDDAWLPSVKVTYNLSDDVMLYASFSKGFKAGGFNGVDITGSSANYPFAPEKVDSYEIGMKSRLFDRRLLFNVTAFRGSYKNLQVTQSVRTDAGASINVVSNAGVARTQGLELEMEWATHSPLRLSANVTYLNAKYLKYDGVSQTTLGSFCRAGANAALRECQEAFGGAPPASQNLAGRPTLFAPRWSGNVDVSYAIHLPAGMTLTPRISPSFSTGYAIEGTLDPRLSENGYVRIDAGIKLAGRDDDWTLAIIGKNLTNEQIRDVGAPLGTAPGTFVAQYQRPRSVVLQATTKW